MGTQIDNKFLWVIKNFNYLLYEKIYSDEFITGGCKWNLFVCPNGDYLSLFLGADKDKLLPCGWKRNVKFSFTIQNQISQTLSHVNEAQKWFDEKTPFWGFSEMIPLSILYEIESGFSVNGELKILVEIDVLQVIAQPLKQIKQEKFDVFPSDSLNMPLQFQEVYGFLVLPSKVESVKRLFENHPDIALEVHTKSHYLKKTYINLLLGLMETLCQSPGELTDNDLKEASIALSCLVNAGFKVDWLEMRLHQVMEKKKRVQYGEARLQELEEEFLKLKKKISEHKTLLEKEKAEIAVANIPLSLDDVL